MPKELDEALTLGAGSFASPSAGVRWWLLMGFPLMRGSVHSRAGGRHTLRALQCPPSCPSPTTTSAVVWRALTRPPSAPPPSPLPTSAPLDYPCAPRPAPRPAPAARHLPPHIPPNLPRRVIPARPHHAAARMGGRAAEVQAADRACGSRRSPATGRMKERLLSDIDALHDVAAGQAEAALQVERAQDLPVRSPRGLKFGRVLAPSSRSSGRRTSPSPPPATSPGASL